jgi:hypothetical protein
MTKDTEHFSLQHSESVVAGMAATLMAAYIQSGAVADDNEDVYVRTCVRLAAKLADATDKAIKSDEEWMAKTGRVGAIL